MAGKQITLLDDEQWPKAGFSFTLPVRPESTALGIIDVQHYCIDSSGHLAGVVKRHSLELYEGYRQRLQKMIRNIQELLKKFRAAGRRVFYTRHGVQMPDGGDLVLRRRSREDLALASSNRTAGHMAVKGTPGYEIIPEVAPLPGELLLDKNTSSAFHSTPIDLFLRNLQVETIVLTGIAADMCVFTTALDAADRGFNVVIAADACANLDPGSAEAVQVLFGRTFGQVMKTEDVIRLLDAQR